MSENCLLFECQRINNNYELINAVYNNFIHLKEFPSLQHNKEEIRKMLNREEFYGLLIYSSKKKLIAYLLGEKMKLNDGRYVYYISYIYVIKEYRSQGIGKRLLKKVINKCKNNFGISFILLTCENENIKARQFYAKQGFVLEKFLPFPPGNTIYCYFV